MQKIAIIYDSRTGTTAKAAKYISEGIKEICEAKIFSLSDVDMDYVKTCDGIILGSPTYFASLTANMKAWMESEAPQLGLAGKLGGAFATEQYIHGGAESAIQILLTHEMVLGMMVYSGGGSHGTPVIHIGPVGLSQNIEDFRDLFVVYGKRFAMQVLSIAEKSN
ncbi:flavodoxin family protein [Acidaminococcus fermentans]|uniref:flavodoxin family protein n=1 Tax=Acidaminococcus fermentans TaxID=905 RepID=UPI002E79C9AA|nr:flavodoxin family protein [Acidaminococcus fermentans]MEE1598814.1 flavodoxin family protein [Acidaminococcus fermentans]MEE4123076.1 flavodoxin family protein [Acidaminococcus fermentans]